MNVYENQFISKFLPLVSKTENVQLTQFLPESIYNIKSSLYNSYINFYFIRFLSSYFSKIVNKHSEKKFFPSMYNLNGQVIVIKYYYKAI